MGALDQSKLVEACSRFTKSVFCNSFCNLAKAPPMPMFVFISGYFYKQRNVIDSLYKKIKSLFLPYILLSVIGAGFCYLLHVFIGLNWYKGFSLESLVWTLSVGPYIGNVNFPLWFALMLFQVSITYILFRWVLKPSIVNDVILTVLFTASNIISVYISINGFLFYHIF